MVPFSIWLLQETCCAADCNALAIAAIGLSRQRLESLRLLACGVNATSIPQELGRFDKTKPEIISFLATE